MIIITSECSLRSCLLWAEWCQFQERRIAEYEQHLLPFVGKMGDIERTLLNSFSRRLWHNTRKKKKHNSSYLFAFVSFNVLLRFFDCFTCMFYSLFLIDLTLKSMLSIQSVPYVLLYFEEENWQNDAKGYLRVRIMYCIYVRIGVNKLHLFIGRNAAKVNRIA